MNFKNKIFLILIIVLQNISSNAYGRRKSFFEFNRNPIKEKFDSLKSKEEYEDIVRKKIATIENRIQNSSDQDEIENLVNRKKKYENILDGDWGDILLAGIAGEYAKNAPIDPVGNNVTEGALKGSALLLVGAASSSVSNVMEDYSKRGFGKIFGFIENTFNFLNRILFHKGKKPFTTSEIDAWKKLISSDLREIETMVRNAEKYSSRSREEIFRELETGLINDEEKELNLWKDFIEDIAYTCEQLAEEIENRKTYYKKKTIGFGIQNCSERLQNKLLKIKNWLISVQSVKDFAGLSEIKLIITAMRKSIENYFDNLSNQIRPLDSSKNKPRYNTNSSRKNNNWNKDNDFPSYLLGE